MKLSRFKSRLNKAQVGIYDSDETLTVMAMNPTVAYSAEAAVGGDLSCWIADVECG
ncbi:hypothetical protein [Thiobacillus sp.]|uniref:hypothetical protein n=1 Tax=Thiobacillus sp. TaxID=924 RepID=UPI00183715C7|nr:hypothetical protein [Thiobacillus sp.]MBC2731674.1 hypothetical protein [Thiobacillus sp.]MBC2740412.1 hypothetical protein [Thiobacillus sp.]MBC2759179.1 hypothetical protein [Thiobacillus sp.]